MSLLETIENLKQTRKYSIDQIYDIATKIEEELGPAEMWNTLGPAFTTDELIENLEYIAKEHDL
jgi:hypothetical protein